mgnify:CR=1 FL=1
MYKLSPNDSLKGAVSAQFSDEDDKPVEAGAGH